ncbi:Low temperature requirement A [Akanthomyces lecanii RCEF 1005]|uniref:Low temperature requirement A n=1 Tax=Akanthomyces lecanii RCEF 1005 TaxID=1081108 RepID=A0A168IJC4_CORDF|nr:Low temperature requirement A [Akanthomyces lecanii RCEF 1005]
MSHTPTGRRFKAQEFTLPSGKKIIASLPGDIPTLRKQHSESDADVVEHGSDAHINYLRQVHSHHEGRRDEMRARLGDAASEWEETHRQLTSVSMELEKLARRESALDHNFDKFGYNKHLRTYDGVLGDGSGVGGGSGAGGAATSGVSTPGDLETGGDEKRHRHGRGDSTKLFKMPVVRQWFHRGVIWRAAGQTEIMAIELFFDLLYVGIIHSNGEHMAEEPTGHELLRFAITFIMSWKIWTEITYALSWFESDDVLTKVEVLFNLACLLGFTTNMISSLNEDPAHNTYAQLVGFYLATRYAVAFHFAINYFLLPMIRGFMLASCIQVVLPTALWIGSIYVEMPNRLILIWIAIVLDMWGQIFYFAPVQYTLRCKEESDTPFTRGVRNMFDYMPAVNIEHRVERTNAFVSLVLGYSVVGILFQSNGGYNINAFLGKAILGLLQAFFFNWIYFDVDGNGIELHAIRRSAVAMGIWNNAHLPFIMGYIIATSALSRLVLASDMSNTNPEQLTESYRALAEEEFGTGVRYFYCHGLAIALLSMTAIAISHKHHSVGTPRLAKKYRLANRVAMAIIMFFLPLATELKSLYLISITLGLISWVLILELWGGSLKGHSFVGETDCTRKAVRGTKEEEDANLPPVT